MSVAVAESLAAQSKIQPLELTPALKTDPGLLSDRALVPVAEKLNAGERLDRADGLAMMQTTDIIGLGHMAHLARTAKNSDLAYYVVNRHVNYSNVCVNGCRFCAFQRKEGQKGGYLLTPEEAATQVKNPVGLRVDEIHIVGSCHPHLEFSYYVDLLKAVSKARPGAALKCFTPVEIEHMAQTGGGSVEEVLDALIEAGLSCMPGGGAEVFSPRVRQKLCPKKADGPRWLEIAGMAHQRGIPTNATMLYGHIETPEERVEHLLDLRGQQDKTKGFNAFIPLAFHPGNTELSQLSATTGLDDLRVIASSRLLLDNFPHIKAYWVMLGTKLAQLALSFGADDLDGTIVEEKITHMAGATTAKGLTEAQLVRIIKAAGFSPLRRDAFYQPADSK